MSGSKYETRGVGTFEEGVGKVEKGGSKYEESGSKFEAGGIKHEGEEVSGLSLAEQARHAAEKAEQARIRKEAEAVAAGKAAKEAQALYKKALAAEKTAKSATSKGEQAGKAAEEARAEIEAAVRKAQQLADEACSPHVEIEKKQTWGEYLQSFVPESLKEHTATIGERVSAAWTKSMSELRKMNDQAKELWEATTEERRSSQEYMAAKSRLEDCNREAVDTYKEMEDIARRMKRLDKNSREYNQALQELTEAHKRADISMKNVQEAYANMERLIKVPPGEEINKLRMDLDTLYLQSKAAFNTAGDKARSNEPVMKAKANFDSLYERSTQCFKELETSGQRSGVKGGGTEALQRRVQECVDSINNAYEQLISSLRNAGVDVSKFEGSHLGKIRGMHGIQQEETLESGFKGGVGSVSQQQQREPIGVSGLSSIPSQTGSVESGSKQGMRTGILEHGEHSSERGYGTGPSQHEFRKM